MLGDCDIAEADRALRGRDGCFMLSPCVDTGYLWELVESHARDTASAGVALPICMEYVVSRGNFCIYPSGGFDDAEVSIFLLGLGESIVRSGLGFNITGSKH